MCECNRETEVHQDFILINHLVALDLYFSLGTDLILSKEYLSLIIKHDLKVLTRELSFLLPSFPHLSALPPHPNMQFLLNATSVSGIVVGCLFWDLAIIYKILALPITFNLSILTYSFPFNYAQSLLNFFKLSQLHCPLQHSCSHLLCPHNPPGHLKPRNCGCAKGTATKPPFKLYFSEVGA